jgi:hypothetical protein
MIWYLVAGGVGAPPTVGVSFDGTLPAGAVACTAEQAADPAAWVISGAALSAAPTVTPTLAQQAGGMLSAGMQIASASAPALNGTYACDAATFQGVIGIVSAVAAGLGLPGGGATFNWLDMAGASHQFTADQFKTFAQAMMNFEYALSTIIGANTGALPTLPVEIA